MYDLYVPITGTPSLRYSYKEAKDQAREALSILGKEYLDQVDYIFNNRVIDVVESKSKVTGAYSGEAMILIRMNCLTGRMISMHFTP